MQAVERRIYDILAPLAAELTLRLVRVRLIGERGSPTLQVMIEPLEGGTVTVEQCETMSRRSSVLLDVEDPINGAYRLEVSSPGMERPLVTAEDFIRFTGAAAKVETQRLVNGRRHFQGRLTGINGETVTMRDEAGQDYQVPLADIREAHLVMSAEDFAAALAKKARKN